MGKSVLNGATLPPAIASVRFAGVAPDEDDDVERGLGDDDRWMGPAVPHLPLPPDDRVWRHPSEFGAQSRAQRGEQRLLRRHRRTRRFVAVGTVATAVALGALVGVISSDDSRTSRSPLAIDGDNEEEARLGADEVLSGPVVTVEFRASGRRSLARATLYRDRYLLTAARLSAEADSISVVGVTGGAVAATVVGTDTHTDLAVLRVDGRTEGAALRRRSALVTGTAVTVMTGSAPSGGAQQATVSATDLGVRTPDGVDIFGLARIDAPPQPEMTGAAVLDGSGRLVGVVNALEFDEPSSGDRSLMVLPATIAANVADSIIDTGAPQHAWLGVTIVDRPPGDTAPCPEGVAVTVVHPGSPAEEAQMRPGVLVVGIGGQDTPTVDAVMAKMRTLQPGDATTVQLCSAGTTMTRPIVVVESPVEG
jgi:S1-C subfamily serine protease